MDSSIRSVHGNTNMVSMDEENIVAHLRERNLDYVNRVSAEVHPKNTMYTRVIKRVLDVLISLPAFIILLPFNFVFAVCTFLDVGHPIIFKQTRSGKDGKPFVMVKFRNMNEKKDADGRLLSPSQRVTRFGRFMRKYSLDELLNFWSVLKGDMSIIGPRPQPVFIYERMSERHKMRGAVRPGLECPRVIHVPDENIYKFQRTFENDIWYVENCSFLTDCKMLFALVKMVFAMGKRGDQASGKGITYFVGYDSNGRAISLRNYKQLGYEAVMGRDGSSELNTVGTDHEAVEEAAATTEQREEEEMVTV